MRVVLDTNILISACWTPGGNEARVIAMAVGGALEIAVSDELEAEYRDVAGRKKFAKQREALEAAIDSLLAVAVRVQPVAECEACSDADDNQLLDCAVAAGARSLNLVTAAAMALAEALRQTDGFPKPVA